MGFATTAIHAGQEPDSATGAVTVPMYQTSTYAQERPGVHKGFEYSRSQNPTRFAFERCVADLESGVRAYAFSSGLAAIGTILELLEYLEGLGVRPGVMLDVLARNYDETLTLRVHGKALQLGRPAASKVWVQSPN